MQGMKARHVISERIGIVLPGWLESSFAGTPLWAWLGLLAVVPVVMLVARLAGRVACSVANRRAEQSRIKKLVVSLRGPVQIGLATALFHLFRIPLPLAPSLDGFLHYCELAVGTVAGLWVAVRFIAWGAGHIARIFDRSGRSHAKAVIPLLQKVLQSAVVLFGVVFLLQNLGIDVGAILAGLGIGGLALALAGKRTVEDLFAGVTLVMDQPARVGDFCKFGTSSGTIEDIGLRSTRVRTADRTLITIPNAKLCELPIENVTARERILLKTTLSLRYETTPSQMRGVLDGIRTLLESREDIAPGARVRFVEYGEAALNLEIFCYVATRDINQFLKTREEIFLGLMDVVEKEGTGFASPSPPVILQQAPASVPAKSQELEEPSKIVTPASVQFSGAPS